MDAITSFSYKPLRLSFVLSALGFAMAGVLAITAFFSHHNGMAYGLLSVIFLMSSLPLLCVGILGEYIGRVYDEVRQRPLSIINHVYRTDQAFSAEEFTSERMSLEAQETILKKLFPAA